MKCFICNGDFKEADLEPIFTGRRRLVCYQCLNRGNKQVTNSRCDYFNTYDGRRRIEVSRRKGGQNGSKNY